MSENLIVFLIVFLAATAITGILAIKFFEIGTFDDPWKSQLYFASAILIAMAYLLVFVIAAYLWGVPVKDGDAAARGKEVFDSLIKILPPIITLILGYYFGANSPSRRAKQGDPK